jgi:hypothetical protein
MESSEQLIGNVLVVCVRNNHSGAEPEHRSRSLVKISAQLPKTDGSSFSQTKQNKKQSSGRRSQPIPELTWTISTQSFHVDSRPMYALPIFIIKIKEKTKATGVVAQGTA